MDNSWKSIEPYRGAHLRIKFHDIYHHGIYVSDDCVVQFGLPMDVYDKPEKVKVIATSFNEFISFGEFCEVRTFSQEEKQTKRDDEEICEFALSKIGMGGYNLIHNNCEHFANLCVFGKKISKQVEDVYKNVELLLKGIKI